MSKKLEIKKEYKLKVLELMLDGRLDAYSSTMLDDHLEEEIRAGNYDICLNLEKVIYISSAGIRILVKHYKQLKAVKGQLFISNISKEAKSVLEMVGLNDLLSDKLNIQPIERMEDEESFINGMVYTRSVIEEGAKLNATFYGTPRKIHSSKFNAEDLRTVAFSQNKYGIGFGAFGDDFDDCSKRFGEFIGIGDSLAYLPTDGSNTPDYTVKTGKLIPEIKSLYGIIFEGKFSDLIHFKPELVGGDVSFSNLINDFSSFTKFNTAAYVMIGETSGLIGASIIKPPTELKSGYSPFRFPEIRDFINFTTEPEYSNMLTVTVGISMKDPEDKYKCLLRPLSEKLNIWGHFHTAVFSFHPIGKKDIKLNETVSMLFETDKIQQVVHLINDERCISGIGESEFVHGRCWVGEMNVELCDNKEG